MGILDFLIGNQGHTSGRMGLFDPPPSTSQAIQAMPNTGPPPSTTSRASTTPGGSGVMGSTGGFFSDFLGGMQAQLEPAAVRAARITAENQARKQRQIAAIMSGQSPDGQVIAGPGQIEAGQDTGAVTTPTGGPMPTTANNLPYTQKQIEQMRTVDTTTAAQMAQDNKTVLDQRQRTLENQIKADQLQLSLNKAVHQAGSGTAAVINTVDMSLHEVLSMVPKIGDTMLPDFGDDAWKDGGDRVLSINFLKLFDPTSAVMAGELQGLVDRGAWSALKNEVDAITSGKRAALDEDSRRFMYDSLVNAREYLIGQYNEQVSPYVSLGGKGARQWGLPSAPASYQGSPSRYQPVGKVRIITPGG